MKNTKEKDLQKKYIKRNGTMQEKDWKEKQDEKDYIK